MKHVYAVIMCGGKGTRFWPLSIAKYPKQFLTFQGKVSMLTKAIERLEKLIPSSNIIICGNKEHERLLVKHAVGISRNNIIAEPQGRNTAPCLAAATAFIEKKDKNAIIIAVPADHVIEKETHFLVLLKVAARHVRENDEFVTLGIKPNSAHTGYGYIERTNKKNQYGKTAVYKVKRFVEKPNAKCAREYIRKKTYSWNSGMFIFSIQTMKTALKKCLPALFEEYKMLYETGNKKEFDCALRKSYKKIKPISIDYGIMEKIPYVSVIIADIGWNDVGSWRALEDIYKKDNKKNVREGNVVVLNGNDNIVINKENKKIIALAHIDEIIVVNSKDALLIVPKGQDQSVREIIEQLKKRKLLRYL